MRCSVCKHPKLQDIDQALLAGVTLASLAKPHKLSVTALHRHRQHLEVRLNDARRAMNKAFQYDQLVILAGSLHQVLKVRDQAFQEGDGKMVVRCSRELGQVLKQINSLDFRLDDLAMYQALNSPDWPQQPTVIPVAPQYWAASRRALTQRLSDPCPPKPRSPKKPAAPDNSDSKLTPQSLREKIKDLPEKHRGFISSLFPSFHPLPKDTPEDSHPLVALAEKFLENPPPQPKNHEPETTASEPDSPHQASNTLATDHWSLITGNSETDPPHLAPDALTTDHWSLITDYSESDPPPPAPVPADPPAPSRPALPGNYPENYRKIFEKKADKELLIPAPSDLPPQNPASPPEPPAPDPHPLDLPDDNDPVAVARFVRNLYDGLGNPRYADDDRFLPVRQRRGKRWDAW